MLSPGFQYPAGDLRNGHVAGDLDPMYVKLVTKPSHLTLGELARAYHDALQGGLFRHPAIGQRQRLGIADGLPGGGRKRTAGTQGDGLIHEAILEHPPRAALDTRMKLVARQAQDRHNGGAARAPCGRGGCSVAFGGLLFGTFQRTDAAARVIAVARGECGSIAKGLERPPESLEPLACVEFLPVGAPFRNGRRTVTLGRAAHAPASLQR